MHGSRNDHMFMFCDPDSQSIVDPNSSCTVCDSRITKHNKKKQCIFGDPIFECLTIPVYFW